MPDISGFVSLMQPAKKWRYTWQFNGDIRCVLLKCFSL